MAVRHSRRGSPRAPCQANFGHACHGWFNSDALSEVVGEEHAKKLIKKARYKSTDGFVCFFERYMDRQGRELQAYYVRCENHLMEKPRISLSSWVKLSQWFDTMVELLDGGCHGLLSDNENEVEDAWNKVEPVYRQWMSTYAGYPDDSTVRPTFLKALRTLWQQKKLLGIHRQLQLKDKPRKESPAESVIKFFKTKVEAPLAYQFNSPGEKKLSRKLLGKFSEIKPAFFFLILAVIFHHVEVLNNLYPEQQYITDQIEAFTGIRLTSNYNGWLKSIKSIKDAMLYQSTHNWKSIVNETVSLFSTLNEVLFNLTGGAATPILLSTPSTVNISDSGTPTKFIGNFPKVEQRERNDRGQFMKTDASILVLLGRYQAAFPQVGRKSLIEGLGFAQAIALKQYGVLDKCDIESFIPTSTDIFALATKYDGNLSFLRHVVKAVKSGICGIACDGGYRSGKNLFPVTLSYFDSEERKIVYFLIEASTCGKTALAGARTIHYAMERVKLAKELALKHGLLQESENEDLVVGGIVADGASDMTSVPKYLREKDLLGYDVPIVHCILHGWSLLLYNSYKEVFGEADKPAHDKKGILALLMQNSWTFADNLPRKRRIDYLEKVSEDHPEQFKELLEKVEDLESAAKELSKPYTNVVMMTRWGTVTKALRFICSNWDYLKKLYNAIADGETGVLRKSCTIAFKWMCCSVLRIQCEFLDTFCQLFYTPWYRVMLSDEPSCYKYRDRDLVAGFRSGELLTWCASMKVELNSLTSDWEKLIKDPDAKLPDAVGKDGEDGPLASRKPMVDFQQRWKKFVEERPEQVELAKKAFTCFFRKCHEMLDHYNKQWFTTLLPFSLDDSCNVTAFTVRYILCIVASYQGEFAQFHKANAKLKKADNTEFHQKLAELIDTKVVVPLQLQEQVSDNVPEKLWSWSPMVSGRDRAKVIHQHVIDWVKDMTFRATNGRYVTGKTAQVDLWPAFVSVGEMWSQSMTDKAEVVAKVVGCHHQMSERAVKTCGEVGKGKGGLTDTNRTARSIAVASARLDKASAVQRVQSANGVVRNLKRALFEENETSESSTPSKKAKKTVFTATSAETREYVEMVLKHTPSEAECDVIEEFMIREVDLKASRGR